MKKYGKLITTLLTAFLIAALIIAVKNCYSNRLPNSDMGVVSVISRGHVNTLFMGSSAYRKGIDMYMIEEKSESEAFMLTYNGNQPFNMAIELEEILKGGAVIDTLVVDFNPSMIDRGADLSDKRLLWDISMDGKKKLWSEMSQLDNASLFTWYDFWVSSNMDYAFTYPIAKPMISKRYYLGGSAAVDNTKGLSKDELENLPIKEEPGLNELQLKSIDEIIRLCAENDIRLIFLESPRYITMESDTNYKDKLIKLKEYISKRGVRVLTNDELLFDNTNPAYYSDLTHMSREGSEVFTKMLLEELFIQ